MKVYKSLRTRLQYSIYLWTQTRIWSKSTDQCLKYLGIRTCLVTVHAPWVVHTTAVGQRQRNYDVTIARHRTLRSHAWRITGGSRHALTTPQYLDKTDSADRRRYSCDVIKTLRATEATCSATSNAIAAAIIRVHTRDDYTLRVIRGI